MKIPTPTQLVAGIQAHGWQVPTGLHVVILRNRYGALDAFDDMLCLVQGSSALAFACRCTADPGRPERTKPTNRQGCAVWAVSQVVDGLGFGRHHDQYECLVPVKPIPVLRYEGLADSTPTPSSSMTTQIHRASAAHESTVVGAWSAGCVVVANPEDFARGMELCHASGQRRFTPTLLNWE